MRVCLAGLGWAVAIPHPEPYIMHLLWLSHSQNFIYKAFGSDEISMFPPPTPQTFYPTQYWNCKRLIWKAAEAIGAILHNSLSKTTLNKTEIQYLLLSKMGCGNMGGCMGGWGNHQSSLTKLFVCQVMQVAHNTDNTKRCVIRSMRGGSCGWDSTKLPTIHDTSILHFDQQMFENICECSKSIFHWLSHRLVWRRSIYNCHSTMPIISSYTTIASTNHSWAILKPKTNSQVLHDVEVHFSKLCYHIYKYIYIYIYIYIIIYIYIYCAIKTSHLDRYPRWCAPAWPSRY